MRSPLTLLLSAFLLFCVQPMAARALVPLFGGSSSVWNACLVFFQAMLLLGYAYAHGATRLLGERRQAWLHGALVWLPLLVLPIAIGPEDLDTLGPGLPPALALLVTLARRVALPFFVLSTSSPLLSRWYAGTDAGRRQGAYWLYAASNAGSLVALVAYPAVIEPLIPLRLQARLWQAGYVGFALLATACAWSAARASAGRGEPEPGAAPVPAAAGVARERLRWVVLAAIPSSLLSGVTGYLTTDIASIPLLWVIPLGLYLLTFSLCFATRPPLTLAQSSRALVLPAAISVLLLGGMVTSPLWLALGSNLAAFFLGAMVCHGRLAQERPGPERLTEFFLLLSLGGVLGGAFNALAAPLLFPALIEYPLALVLACLCRVPVGDPPDDGAQAPSWWRDLGFAALIALLTAALVWAASRRSGPVDASTVGMIFLPPILLVYRSLHIPRRFALGMLAVLAGSAHYRGQFGEVLWRERSFYSAVRVSIDASGQFRQIIHGDTVHGMQFIDPARRGLAVGYYHREGPLGAVMALPRGPGRVGVVGLGVGTMATYAGPGDAWVYYEIDPLVARVAENVNYFSFLHDARSRGATVSVALGDARLRLREAERGSFALLLLDAFSSDAIPTHLLTREAAALYLEKLAPEGRLGFHVSNRFLDLRPVLGRLGVELSLDVLCREDTVLGPSGEPTEGHLPSVWCLAQRRGQGLRAALPPSWVPPEPGMLWTDDRSSLLPLLTWRAVTH